MPIGQTIWLKVTPCNFIFSYKAAGLSLTKKHYGSESLTYTRGHLGPKYREDLPPVLDP